MQSLSKILLVLAAIAFLGNVSAQVASKVDLPHTHVAQTSPTVIDDGNEVVNPFNGTYRFVFTKGIKQIFTDDIFTTIEMNRKEEEDVTIVLSPYCKVEILSRKKITSAGFIPYTKSYVFLKIN